MTEATPLSLRYDGIMSGSCREQFGHFVLMTEVSSVVVSCKLPLNDAWKFLSSSISLFYLVLSASSALCKKIIYQFYFLWTSICYCHPSFRPARCRSDPFVGNYCIFNPDLDNGTLTVIFASGLFAALRQFMSLTLCISSLPIIETLTNSKQCYNTNDVLATPYLPFKIFISVLWSFSTMFSFFVHRVCVVWWLSSSCLALTGGHL